MAASRLTRRRNQRARRTGRQRPSNAATSAGPLVEASLQVERLVARGLGLARLQDGRIALIRGALPGDTLRPTAVRERQRYIEVEQFELQAPASTRRAPPCPYATRCGGCSLMPLEPAAQQRAKRQLLEDVLRRTARLEPRDVPLRWHAIDDALGYRSRVRVHLTGDGQLGFHSPASHDVVDVERCLVASERVNTLLARVRRLLLRHPQWFAPLRELELRALAALPELTLFSRKDAPRDRLRAALAGLRAALPDVVIGLAMDTATQAVARSQPMTLANDIQARVAPGAFTQVNWSVNQAIISELLTGAATRDLHTFADVYCGIGNFALPLLQQGLLGRGIESNPVAIALARHAARAQGLEGWFEVERAEQALSSWAAHGEQFDLVILDPPRAGIGSMARTLAEVARRAVFICACDPVPFARDLRQLLDLGFRLESLSVYEMFPQTHHFELAAWLRAPS